MDKLSLEKMQQTFNHQTPDTPPIAYNTSIETLGERTMQDSLKK